MALLCAYLVHWWGRLQGQLPCECLLDVYMWLMHFLAQWPQGSWTLYSEAGFSERDVGYNPLCLYVCVCMCGHRCALWPHSDCVCGGRSRSLLSPVSIWGRDWTQVLKLGVAGTLIAEPFHQLQKIKNIFVNCLEGLERWLNSLNRPQLLL